MEKKCLFIYFTPMHPYFLCSAVIMSTSEKKLLLIICESLQDSWHCVQMKDDSIL